MTLVRRVNDEEVGISLVEMMVAIIIVGIALTALSSSLISSLHAVARAEEETTSTALANEVLEQFQALDFRKVALYHGEAQAVFGAGVTHVGGEPLVLIPDATPRDPDVLRPSRLVERNGTEFTVETAVTWLDDATDGSGAGDADGPEDVKHVVATIRWSPLRGSTRSVVVEARRTPTPGDLILEGTISPDVVRLSDAPEGKNAVAFTINARTDRRFNSIKVTFETRGSTPSSPIYATRFLTTSDAGFTWSATVLANTMAFNNGETLFTFEGTPVAGSTVTVTDRVLFLHDISIPDVTVTDSTADTDAIVTVAPSGALCEPVQLVATVHGVTASDSVEVRWAGDVPVVSSGIFVSPPLESGGRFAVDYPIGTVFQVSDNSSISGTVTAGRSAEVPGAPASEVTVSTGPFPVTVLEEGCPT